MDNISFTNLACKKDAIQKGFIDNNLEKGHVGDSLGYNPDLKASKTGKEIKEKATSLQSLLNQKCENIKTRMTVLEDLIGECPNSRMDSYYYKGYQDRIGEMKQYSWEFYNKQECRNEINLSSVIEDSTPTKTTTYSLCCEYNELVRQCLETQIDIITLGTIIRNLEDNKKYELSLNQLTTLNF